jgi:hypothetical protein
MLWATHINLDLTPPFVFLSFPSFFLGGEGGGVPSRTVYSSLTYPSPTPPTQPQQPATKRNPRKALSRVTQAL